MKRYLIYIILIGIGLRLQTVAAVETETISPLYSTEVYKTLERMVNIKGKFQRVDFADGTSQSSAGLTSVTLGTNTTGITPITQGGTGSNTAAGARASLALAKSGDNDDITGLGTVTMSGNIKLNGQYLSGDGGNEGIYVQSDGKVCIGNTNSQYALDVTGSGRFTNTVDFNNLINVDNYVQVPRIVCGGATNLQLIPGGRNVGLHTNSFGTGTGMLAIANGTVTGMAAISNQGEIFCEGGELKVMDGTGNITPISPHSELDTLVTNLTDPLPHTYVSTNSYIGKKKIVNMSVLIAEIEKLSGKTLVTYEDVPLRDWTTDQDSFRVQIDLERLKVESDIDAINTQIAEANQAETEKINELQKKKSQLNKEILPEYIPQHPPKWMQDRGVTLNL